LNNKIWLIADTHFNHKKVDEWCNRKPGWEDKLRGGLAAIPDEDVLIHLGDICIGAEKETHGILQRVSNCKKWLIRGNHDKKTNSWYLSHGWDVVCENMGVRCCGTNVLLSHKPMPFRPDIYDINIHGHFHNIGLERCYECEPSLPPYHGKWHYRLSCEETNYQPILLETLLEKRRKIKRELIKTK